MISNYSQYFFIKSSRTYLSAFLIPA